ncbi:MAG: tetratricopeptide repeat protein, partial [Acidobacteriota bacterium]|nr:tetratricopeptide repeat protein [Acidobacteriota bacterium]
MLTTRNIPVTRSAAIVLLGVLLISVPVWPQTGGTAAELAQRAVEAVKVGDYEAAVAGFRSALERDPELHQVRFQLARVLATQGQFESAVEEFRLVVEARPEDGLARRGEVTALLLLGRYADARRRL